MRTGLQSWRGRLVTEHRHPRECSFSYKIRRFGPFAGPRSSNKFDPEVAIEGDKLSDPIVEAFPNGQRLASLGSDRTIKALFVEPDVLQPPAFSCLDLSIGEPAGETAGG